MAHLGHMYANGYGPKQDMAAAEDLWTTAGKRNHPNALFALGYMHLVGEGATRDADRAFK